ncbi:MAG: VOC family protein [Bacteroidetes bacterium]|nr:VOC family protein [Bacteroidota bacterium]
MITPLNLGIKLPTHKLSESKWFYKNLLGLQITKETKEIVVFEQGLSLVPDANYSTSQYGGSSVRTLVYLEVVDLETLFYRLRDVGINILSPPSPWNNSKRTYFACNDPDGNIIEIFSAKESSIIPKVPVGYAGGFQCDYPA